DASDPETVAHEIKEFLAGLRIPYVHSTWPVQTPAAANDLSAVRTERNAFHPGFADREEFFSVLRVPYRQRAIQATNDETLTVGTVRHAVRMGVREGKNDALIDPQMVFLPLPRIIVLSRPPAPDVIRYPPT